MTNKEVLGTTVVSHKYQITLPKRVRVCYKFEKGDLIVFERDGERLYVKTGKDL